MLYDMSKGEKLISPFKIRVFQISNELSRRKLLKRIYNYHKVINIFRIAVKKAISLRFY